MLKSASDDGLHPAAAVRTHRGTAILAVFVMLRQCCAWPCSSWSGSKGHLVLQR